MGNRNKTELKDNKGLLPHEHATDAELVKLLGGTPLPADKKVIRINPKMINMVPPNMLQQVGAAHTHSHSAVHQHQQQHQPMIQTLAPSHSGLPVRAHLPHSAHHHSAPAAAFQKTRFRNPRMINSTQNFSSARKLSSETTSNSTAEVKLTKTQNSKDQASDEALVKKKDEGLKLQLPQDKTYLDTINDGKSDSDESENDDRYVDLLLRVLKLRFSVVEDIKEAAAGDFLKYLLIKHCRTHELESAHRKS